MHTPSILAAALIAASGAAQGFPTITFDPPGGASVDVIKEVRPGAWHIELTNSTDDAPLSITVRMSAAESVAGLLIQLPDAYERTTLSIHADSTPSIRSRQFRTFVSPVSIAHPVASPRRQRAAGLSSRTSGHWRSARSSPTRS